MDKRKLEVDAAVSNKINSISDIIRVLGWFCFAISIVVILSDFFYIGLNGVIFSLSSVITGFILRGFAIIINNAEISIAAQKDIFDVTNIEDKIEIK